MFWPVLGIEREQKPHCVVVCCGWELARFSQDIMGSGTHAIPGLTLELGILEFRQYIYSESKTTSSLNPKVEIG